MKFEANLPTARLDLVTKTRERFSPAIGDLLFFVFGKLPQYKLDQHYSARFSAEEFGLVVRCRESDVQEIDTLLRDHQATEVNLVES